MYLYKSLRALYTDLQAQVALWPGVESRNFNVKRGVRQGDPLSPLLFNLVMKDVLEEVGTIWARRGYGTNVGRDGAGRRLTHCVFADDTTLIARSWLSLRRMLSTVRSSLARRGLRLHPSKSKVQTNRTDWRQRGVVNIEPGLAVEVVEEDIGLKVLGTVIHLNDATAAEIQKRIGSAWRMFWGMGRILMNKRISVNRRLRVFDATISSCVLWCCESWTPRQEELRNLETAQRAMLRRIAGVARGSDEPWLEWLQRSTHRALERAAHAGVKCWKLTHYKRKYMWAGHVARRDDNSWVHRVTFWRDSAWQGVVADLAQRPRRPARRRWMRFEDCLRRYTAQAGGPNWMEAAQSKALWNSNADIFAHWSVA